MSRFPLPDQTMTTTSIRPPFMLYTLRAEHTTMGSGTAREPAVILIQEDLTGDHVRSHVITPDQARQLAAALTIAAHQAENP